MDSAAVLSVLLKCCVEMPGGSVCSSASVIGFGVVDARDSTAPLRLLLVSLELRTPMVETCEVSCLFLWIRLRDQERLSGVTGDSCLRGAVCVLGDVCAHLSLR